MASTHLAVKPSTTATKASSCGATATGPAQIKGSGVGPSQPVWRFHVETLPSSRTLPWSIWTTTTQPLGMQLWLTHAYQGLQLAMVEHNSCNHFMKNFFQEVWLSFKVLPRQIAQILITSVTTVKKDFLLVEKLEDIFSSSCLLEYVWSYSMPSYWLSLHAAIENGKKLCVDNNFF